MIFQLRDTCDHRRKTSYMCSYFFDLKIRQYNIRTATDAAVQIE